MSFQSSIRVAIAALVVLSSATAGAFQDDFLTWGTIEEAGSMGTSSSPNWWVNSGGRLELRSGLARTIQGNLPSNDRWRLAYAASNPGDTANGYRPQNLLRLVTRTRWQNFREGFYFSVRATDSSSSPNRNGSNGILIFSRYLDSNNLYYAGVRVDGTAVVKKKQAGRYYTLGQVKILPGTYNATSSRNLLPVGQRIGLKARTTTRTDGSVLIQVCWDRLDGRGWQILLEAVDTGASGGSPIRQAGFAGIRTDFMDVEFDTFVLVPLL
jgi:hypothetical protein